MSSDRFTAETTVSDDRTRIPTRIRRQLDIEDDDLLRWRLVDDGSIRIEIVQQHSGTFTDFEGYDGTIETDVTADHDTLSIED